MVGLLDIAPVAESVTIEGADGSSQVLSVPGVSATGIVCLLRRFPVVMQLLDRKAGDDIAGIIGDVGTDDLLRLGADAVNAILAAGCGYPDNPEAEQRLAALDVGTQIDILEAIIRRTMPKGVGPFVERVKRLIAALKVDGVESQPEAARPKAQAAA